MLDRRIHNLKRKLQESRYRLKQMYNEIAEPLYDMKYVATKDVWRMSSNGTCIYFNPDWFQKLGDVEVDYILMHQLMHMILGHIDRPEYYMGDRYHMAADIVVNGNLFHMGWQYVKLPHIGKMRYYTYLPMIQGAELDSWEAIKYVPIDPSIMEPAKRRQYMIDSEEWWDRKEDEGTGGIIILSPLDTDPDDLIYEGPTYGGNFQLKKEIFPEYPQTGDEDESGDKEKKLDAKPINRGHSSDVKSAISALRREANNPESGCESGSLDRYWKDEKVTELDWKSLLHSFVQEELHDYSFMPPDKRIQNGSFFLPDYNVYTQIIRDVSFMVDASGSVSDEMLCMAYNEIKQALEQFNGSLSGTVAFFDTAVHRPTPFECVSDIGQIRPFGGGGTDYESIFRYVRDAHVGAIPTSIVIITDGKGIYPAEEWAEGIPVLWLISGSESAPWGKSVILK